MATFIKKRNEEIVSFNLQKIVIAIQKALMATDQNPNSATKISEKVKLEIDSQFREEVPTVEDIQDIVEKALLREGFIDTAKAYIRYRSQHEQLRNTKDILKKALHLVENYLGKGDWKIKENSNMGFSLQGLNNYISSQVTSAYWLNEIYTPQEREAHENGEIHIHDLGLLSAYCCGWDLFDLLVQGFGGVYGKVESGPPKHFRSALGQIVNFFYTLQGEAAGAQAFSSFDTLLAPFVRRDNLSYKDVKQSIQEFVFNLNIPTRVGFQTPFTNLTMDLEPPQTLADTPIIIAGKPQKETYKDFQKEMDFINKAFCEVMMAGDKRGRVFTFPIPTYNITSDFDWNHKNLDFLWEMSAKYGVPYFSNFVNSDLNPEDARSMCCRLRLDNRELKKRGGGLFGSNPMTGSIGVVTLNLPRAAYVSQKSIESFFDKIKNIANIARSTLITKRKVLERFTDQGLYPYSKHYLSKIKQGQGSYWANHFNTIGIIGMNEACLNLIGKSIDEPEGKEFAIRTLTYIRDLMADFQDQDNMLYNLEATPAEGTSYRLAKKDKDAFSNIITSGESEPFYTNSSQLPVNATTDIFEALDHQDSLQTLYTGGTVLHGFIGERIDDPQMAKQLVKKICDNYHLPYFTITPTFSICPVHGYIRGEHHTCPVYEEV